MCYEVHLFFYFLDKMNLISTLISTIFQYSLKFFEIQKYLNLTIFKKIFKNDFFFEVKLQLKKILFHK